jgi:hypothetical protein
MRISRLLVATAVLGLAALLGGCGSTSSPAPSAPASATASPVKLLYDITQPPTANVLKIGVESATRTGQTITLTLTGTYTGSQFTTWSATTVTAPGCDVTASDGFPQGDFSHGQLVTGKWTLTCSGTGSVDVGVDPFGGLVSGDTTTTISLH